MKTVGELEALCRAGIARAEALGLRVQPGRYNLKVESDTCSHDSRYDNRTCLVGSMALGCHSVQNGSILWVHLSVQRALDISYEELTSLEVGFEGLLYSVVPHAHALGSKLRQELDRKYS